MTPGPLKTKARLTIWLLLAVVAFCGAPSAHADNYSVIGLQGNFQDTIAGGNDVGDYTLFAPSLCYAPDSAGCYATYYSNGQVVYSSTAPLLPADPLATSGSGCNIDTSGFAAVQTFCSNGHELFWGWSLDGNGVKGLFDGSDPFADLVYAGSVDGPVVMTADGSLYFTDGQLDVNLEAVDLEHGKDPSVPEPGSLVLVASGLIFLMAIGMRRAR